MFKPPQLPKVLAYLGPTAEAAKLHTGESFSARLEDEIRIHEGQIQAENFLLNTVAKYQHLAEQKQIPREDLNRILRESHYNLETTRQQMMKRYGISAEEFDSPIDFEPVNVADYMRQRAAMIGAVLSSTPVLLRDPWNGKPATARYGFTDFKAEVDGVGFSAIATPRYKGIPFRFAVMKHEHDGYIDNNPAMIMSNEFCDAFEQYHAEKFSDLPIEQDPLIVSMATNLKPNIHDRFHNWLLYDTQAASNVFKQWGDDIYFVEHADKNPLLINYEQVALCFHLYSWQTLFHKNPSLEDTMYQRLENCMDQVHQFGAFLKEKGNPQAAEIEESTAYAVLSNICFVLNPFDARFQQILEHYPDVKHKLLEVRDDGKGIGATLERLHGYEDGVPSQKYGGAKEAVMEYILRYPLQEEIQEKLREERSAGRPSDWQEVDGKHIYTMNLKHYQALPPDIRNQLNHVPDSGVFAKINAALAKLPEGMREDISSRVAVSEEGYFFMRMDRKELDYTQFEPYTQNKKVLLIDIPQGKELAFTNQKKLSLKNRVKKQDFHLKGGEDILAINVRDKDAAEIILDAARRPEGIDPERAIAKAQELANTIGEKSAGDIYKIDRKLAASDRLYEFTKSGYYQKTLTKQLAKAPGPIAMELHSGGEQRLIKGAFVYLPQSNDTDNPDCHLIENTDFRRDYKLPLGTETLPALKLSTDSSLMQYDHAQQAFEDFMQTLHEANVQITHGASKAEQLAKGGRGLFS